MPVNFKRIHWIVIYIDFVKKTIACLDSLPGIVDTAIIFNGIKSFVKDHMNALKKKNIVKTDEPVPDLKVIKIDCVKQGNKKDCGVLAVYFIRCQ